MKTINDLINEIEAKIAKLESEKNGWNSRAQFDIAISNMYIALSNLYSKLPLE